MEKPIHCGFNPKADKLPANCSVVYLAKRLVFPILKACFPVRPGPTIACLILLLTRSFAGTGPLTSIPEVRGLSMEAASLEQRVELEACITFYDPTHTSLLIHDGRDGIFVHVGKETAADPNLKAGTRIRVRGVTKPGDFIPHIDGQQLERLGDGPLPEPIHVQGDELYAPMLDCQWVEFAATVSGIDPGSSYFTLVLEVSGWTFKAQLPDRPEAASLAAQRMQRVVKVRGVVGTVFNAQRQLTGRYFFVPSFEQIVPIELPEASAPARLLQVDELLRSNASRKERVRVQGIVTHAGREGLYLRGTGGSLLVRTVEGSHFAPGKRIEAIGYPEVAPFRPILRATSVISLDDQPAPIPAPFHFTNSELIRQQAELVTIEADFLAQHNGPKNQILFQCQAGSWFFEAELPVGAKPSELLRAHDRIQLTGICELSTTHPLPRAEWVDGFRLQLRGPADLIIIQHAPWWTLSRLLWALSGVGALALGSLAWGSVLRRRVAEQTQVIGAQIERAAIIEERQRISRELHDTIEQDLAGVSIQLRNARQRLTSTPEQAESALELAQRMLRHCRQEARASIRDLRSVVIEQRGLRGALEDLLPPLAQESGAQIAIEFVGESFELPGPAAIHLFRIAHEAVANAARHAAPRHIRVRLQSSVEAIELEIHDDGSGFDPTAPSPRGHFGLSGIRERADKLQAILTITSHLGKGTQIQVVVPSDLPDRTS